MINGLDQWSEYPGDAGVVAYVGSRSDSENNLFAELIDELLSSTAR
jgi:hypothetical protein